MSNLLVRTGTFIGGIVIIGFIAMSAGISGYEIYAYLVY